MSLTEIAALMRQHVVAVSVVLVVAAGTAITFKSTPPTYQESATVILTSPRLMLYSSNESLITTSEVMTRWMMGMQGQQQVRQAGATGAFHVAMVNLYNEQYPNYYRPFVTVTATSHDPGEVHHTFATVTRLLSDDLAARQAQQRVPPNDRITEHNVGDTGPVIQPGSPKRTFAALVLLTTVAVFMVSSFLDRHPIRLRGPLRSSRYGTSDSVARARPAAHGRLDR